MRENVQAGAICGKVVQMLETHYDEIDAARDMASREAGKRYFESLKKGTAG